MPDSSNATRENLRTLAGRLVAAGFEPRWSDIVLAAAECVDRLDAIHDGWNDPRLRLLIEADLDGDRPPIDPPDAERELDLSAPDPSRGALALELLRRIVRRSEVDVDAARLALEVEHFAMWLNDDEAALVVDLMEGRSGAEGFGY